ncbi:helix-hairpin-helix domain-containing protein [Alkalibacterium kapii]|uniref:Competence protein ComEA n=1 Tax=Alkalibacterium kapii TaxID=426704 RepID=A0A511ATJ3_9LACT|nr:helix-hairpin-helix domain-containing protein [Alkalibacterium kapii]GEK91515.1 competence protein ComEA [Alkalibacterium kapii]
MSQFKYLKKIVTGILIAGLLIVIYFMIFKDFNDTDSNENIVTLENLIEENPQNLTEEKSGSDDKELRIEEAADEIVEVVIDIKGAVKTPGVFSLKSSDRIIDAVNAAGGVLENADTKHINFAQILNDEMYIYIPENGENIPEIIETEESLQDKTSLVNINQADETDFLVLDGIGPSKAAAIINYRDEHGLFKTVEDLLNVSGIGKKTFDRIKTAVTID